MNNYSLIFEFLFITALSKGKDIKFPLSGLSMYPVLKEGDILRVKAISYQEAKIGDILASWSFESKRIIVHRLVKKSKDLLGERMFTASEFVPPLSYDLPLNPNNCIIAKVFAIERNKRIINLETKWAKLNNSLRAYLLVNFPLAISLQRKCIKAMEFPHLIPAGISKLLRKVNGLFIRLASTFV
jgi:hypothetical protein